MKLDRVLIVSLCLIVGIPVVKQVAPSIEGRVLPVVSDTSIKPIVNYDGLYSTIYGSSKKVRECTFENLEWYYKTDAGEVKVGVSIDEKAKVRGDGYFDFGAWRVQLSPDQIVNDSYALVTHRCHFLWPTISKFYPNVEE